MLWMECLSWIHNGNIPNADVLSSNHVYIVLAERVPPSYLRVIRIDTIHRIHGMPFSLKLPCPMVARFAACDNEIHTHKILAKYPFERLARNCRIRKDHARTSNLVSRCRVCQVLLTPNCTDALPRPQPHPRIRISVEDIPNGTDKSPRI